MLKAGDLLGQHPHLLLEGGGDIEPGDINRIKAWLESIEKHIAADGLVMRLMKFVTSNRSLNLPELARGEKAAAYAGGLSDFVVASD